MTIIRKSQLLAWTQQNIRLAPEAPGVYVLHDSRRILYIGMSGNLRERLLQHFQENDVPGVTRFEWFEADSEQNARETEAEWIGKYHPPYNAQR